MVLDEWSKVSRKKGQGQPIFKICANLVGPTSPILHTKSQGYCPFGSSEDIIRTNLKGPSSQMLHTKSQGHWLSGSGEDFYSVLTIYGYVVHLGHVTRTVCIHFS